MIKSWVGLWGFCLLSGVGLAQVLANIEPGPLPPQYARGQEKYLQRCGSCHLALPPEVMPSQTWQALLTDNAHYGKTLDPIGNLDRQVIWQYLRDYSRTTKADESTPYYLSSSRYFKALHPKVKLPRTLSPQSCVQCHVNAATGDFLVKE